MHSSSTCRGHDGQVHTSQEAGFLPGGHSCGHDKGHRHQSTKTRSRPRGLFQGTPFPSTASFSPTNTVGDSVTRPARGAHGRRSARRLPSSPSSNFSAWEPSAELLSDGSTCHVVTMKGRALRGRQWPSGVASIILAHTVTGGPCFTGGTPSPTPSGAPFEFICSSWARAPSPAPPAGLPRLQVQVCGRWRPLTPFSQVSPSVSAPPASCFGRTTAPRYPHPLPLTRYRSAVPDSRAFLFPCR